MSQTGGFELLGPRLNLGPKSRQSYINLDMGARQPTETEAAVLAEWLGGYPAEPVAGVGSDDTTLTPAALLKTIDALVTALDADRSDRAKDRKVMLNLAELARGAAAQAMANADRLRVLEERLGVRT